MSLTLIKEKTIFSFFGEMVSDGFYDRFTSELNPPSGRTYPTRAYHGEHKVDVFLSKVLHDGIIIASFPVSVNR